MNIEQAAETEQLVLACAKVLADSRAEQTVLIDLRAMGSWTDWFILATATSSTHMRGLLRQLEEHTDSQKLAALRRPRLGEDDDWCLVDYGDFVVHIMSQQARAFYDLESLWHEGVKTSIESGNLPT